MKRYLSFFDIQSVNFSTKAFFVKPVTFKLAKYKLIEIILIHKKIVLSKNRVMQEKDLHERFVDYLYTNYTPKKKLVSTLTDILKIERESVSRRLSGKVLFTVREIGKIAEDLDISVDWLLHKESSAVFLPFNMIMPLNLESMDSLIKLMEDNTIKIKEICKKSPLHIGHVFSSLPMAFFIPYKNLSKLIYFKWMHYFMKERFNEDYDTWQLPREILNYHEELMVYWKKAKTIFYVWDSPVIWNLVKEIDFLHKMGVLNSDNLSLIKKDLHDLLDNIEIASRDSDTNSDNDGRSIEIYISSVNIGVSCTYFHAADTSLIYYKTPFSQSTIYNDSRAFNKTYEWVNSMKKISNLISGSGAIERRIFFDEQHKIVDQLNR